MDTHKNARLTPKGREEMVRAVADRGMSKAAAAHQFNTTPKTVGKWVENQGANVSCHCYSNHHRHRALGAAPRLSSPPHSRTANGFSWFDAQRAGIPVRTRSIIAPYASGEHDHGAASVWKATWQQTSTAVCAITIVQPMPTPSSACLSFSGSSFKLQTPLCPRRY
jgi:hypothetical protein